MLRCAQCNYGLRRGWRYCAQCGHDCCTPILVHENVALTRLRHSKWADAVVDIPSVNTDAPMQTGAWPPACVLTCGDRACWVVGDELGSVKIITLDLDGDGSAMVRAGPAQLLQERADGPLRPAMVDGVIVFAVGRGVLASDPCAFNEQSPVFERVAEAPVGFAFVGEAAVENGAVYATARRDEDGAIAVVKIVPELAGLVSRPVCIGREPWSTVVSDVFPADADSEPRLLGARASPRVLSVAVKDGVWDLPLGADQDFRGSRWRGLNKVSASIGGLLLSRRAVQECTVDGESFHLVWADTASGETLSVIRWNPREVRSGIAPMYLNPNIPSDTVIGGANCWLGRRETGDTRHAVFLETNGFDDIGPQAIEVNPDEHVQFGFHKNQAGVAVTSESGLVRCRLSTPSGGASSKNVGEGALVGPPLVWGNQIVCAFQPRQGCLTVRAVDLVESES